jgi:hypothetical protein
VVASVVRAQKFVWRSPPSNTSRHCGSIRPRRPSILARNDPIRGVEVDVVATALTPGSTGSDFENSGFTVSLMLLVVLIYMLMLENM